MQVYEADAYLKAINRSRLLAKWQQRRVPSAWRMPRSKNKGGIGSVFLGLLRCSSQPCRTLYVINSPEVEQVGRGWDQRPCEVDLSLKLLD